jgi:long-subunit fatty acid transport protein
MKKIVTYIGFMTLVQLMAAQTVTDGLRYSRFDVSGTARSIGVAGSMSAIGADFSVLSLNPAGIGAYRSSEFVFTPAMFSTRSKSTLQHGENGEYEEKINNFNISNVGIVVGSKPSGSSWKTSNFAFGINKVADFHQDFYYQGNSQGSITDRFLENARGVAAEDLNGFEEGLAYSTGAIYDFNDDQIYESDYRINPDHKLFKSQSVFSEGSNVELLFAYGANLDEKLLIGFSVGVPILVYDEIKFYQEEDEESDEVPFFNELEYEEYLSTTGYGFNFKFGAIYKPTKFVGIGLAVHTPTGYSLTDDYSTDMLYYYTDDTNDIPIEESSPDGSFNYRMRTPWKVVASFGAVIQKSGFVSAELQWTDYSSTEFDYTSRGNGNTYISEEREINQQIKNQLSESIKLKIGGEYASKQFRLRGGLAFEQQPYANDNSFSTSYHAGIGVREKQFYIDLAYQLQTSDEGYTPYALDDVSIQQLVVNNVNKSKMYLTLGYKF